MNREIKFRGKRLDNFGWKPFGGLADKKIKLLGEDDGGGSGTGSGGGRQVSEITGPTRDLLTDLLSPLAHLGSIVAPIQDIRQILYERLPNFNTLDFAGEGAIGGDIGKWVFGDLLTKHPHHEER